MKRLFQCTYPMRQTLYYLCMAIFSVLILATCTKSDIQPFPLLLDETADEYVGLYQLEDDPDFSGHQFIQIRRYEPEIGVGTSQPEYQNTIVIHNFLNQEETIARWNGAEFYSENQNLVMAGLPSIVNARFVKVDEHLLINYLVDNRESCRECRAQFKSMQ